MLSPEERQQQQQEEEEGASPNLDRQTTWRAAQRVPTLVKATTRNAVNNSLMRLYPDILRPETGMGSIRFDISSGRLPSKFVRVSPEHSKPEDRGARQAHRTHGLLAPVRIYCLHACRYD